MKNERFNRWQAQAIAQFSVAIALVYGLSVAGLGAGLSLMQSDKFNPTGCWKCVFGLSQLLFVLTAFLTCVTVISRLLDFRLTARSTIHQQGDGESEPTHFGLNKSQYGKASWGLFWASCISQVIGTILFIAAVAQAFGGKL